MSQQWIHLLLRPQDVPFPAQSQGGSIQVLNAQIFSHKPMVLENGFKSFHFRNIGLWNSGVEYFSCICVPRTAPKQNRIKNSDKIRDKKGEYKKRGWEYSGMHCARVCICSYANATVKFKFYIFLMQEVTFERQELWGPYRSPAIALSRRKSRQLQGRPDSFSIL